MLLINLDNTTTVQAKVAFNSSWTLQHKNKHRGQTIIRLPQGSITGIVREEYHLTAKDGNLHSQTMLLNGNILSVDSSGNIPNLQPVHVNSTGPVMVAPFSIVFVHMPDVILPACR